MLLEARQSQDDLYIPPKYQFLEVFAGFSGFSIAGALICFNIHRVYTKVSLNKRNPSRTIDSLSARLFLGIGNFLCTNSSDIFPHKFSLWIRNCCSLSIGIINESESQSPFVKFPSAWMGNILHDVYLVSSTSWMPMLGNTIENPFKSQTQMD